MKFIDENKFSFLWRNTAAFFGVWLEFGNPSVLVGLIGFVASKDVAVCLFEILKKLSLFVGHR